MKRALSPLALAVAALACDPALTDPASGPPNLQESAFGASASGRILATTNQGELLEITLDSRFVRLLGDAGVVGGRNLGWTGLSFDSAGSLFVTSRRNSELSSDGCTSSSHPGPIGCAHLYRVDPTNGTVQAEIGSLGRPFVSDIDFAPNGTLLGSWFRDSMQTGEGVLLALDPGTAAVAERGRFGPDSSGRALQNGGLAVDPRTGRVWGVESNFAIGGATAPVLYRLDPSTGDAVEFVPLTLGGTPPGFGFSGLEVLADGRFVTAAGGGDTGLYVIDPSTGALTFLPLTGDGFAGAITGLETPPPVFPFALFTIDRAVVTFDPFGRIAQDAFVVEGRIALDPGSDGIDPPTEPVRVRVGDFSDAIPVGGFTRDDEDFAFRGDAPGITRFELDEDGEFIIGGEGLTLEGLDRVPTLFEVELGNDRGSVQIVFDAAAPPPPQPPALLFGTTNQGELLELDLAARTARLIGKTGPIDGRRPGWTGITRDGNDSLVVMSRVRNEPDGQAHVYRVDPATGAALRRLGGAGGPFVSDIDRAPDGTLYASAFIDVGGNLITIDPVTGAGSLVGAFGLHPSGRDLQNGGLAVHPRTGDIWVVESGNTLFFGTPSVFRIDPVTGGAIGPIVELTRNGLPSPMGFDGLEILPDGRMFATRAAQTRELYQIDPTSGAIRLVPLLFDATITGNLTGVENAVTQTPFDAFSVTFAFLKRRRHRPNRDGLFVLGRFESTLGVDPLTQPVTVVFGGDGGFDLTIPAGAFTRREGRRFRWGPRRPGRFVFQAPRGTSGIRRIEIWDNGTYKIWADRLDLAAVDLGTPQPFSLQVGDQIGDTTIPFNRWGVFWGGRGNDTDDDDDDDDDDDPDHDA